MSTQLTTKQFFAQDNVKGKFNELLGDKRSVQFITSVLQCVNSNGLLAKADPNSIFNAAATAAVLDLPVNPNLGFSWIVPYKGQAQFQVGWKGFVQLAQRSGQYLAINVIEVYANQFKSFNTLTEQLDADFTAEGIGNVVGYCAYFRMLNGFEKTAYWTVERVKRHAQKFSQSYTSEKGQSPWKDADLFHEMAKKTVLKNTLSKWGMLSVEMQKAVVVDQAVISDVDATVVEYPDNEPVIPTKEEISEARLLAMLEDCKTIAEVDLMQKDCGADYPTDLFDNRRAAITKKAMEG